MEESYLKELAIDMYCGGKSFAEIAEELGYQLREVRRFCKTYAQRVTNERRKWIAKNGWNWQFAK